MRNAVSLRRAFASSIAALACASAFAAQVDPALATRAQRDGLVEALIVFPDQSNPARVVPDSMDYKLRRRILVDALRTRAAAQQRNARAWLDARGVEYRAYWISNLIWARLSASDLNGMAARDDIARIVANPHIANFPPAPSAAMAQPDAVEWGVGQINAPQVWAAGYTGQGVVIAGEDTGYQWDHPALESHYRGWDGTVADHNHNWHDAIHAGSDANSCGVDLPVPCDDQGHGTHTAGTFAGDDGGSNQIGVAPGAKWIGCRNMDAGVGTPARYIECMQWMLAPTDLAGQNPEPDLAPDIINNSWGCPASEGCTAGDEIKTAVDNVVAGGIFFVAAAGNGGTACGTIADPPAIYASAFVVGATSSNDAVASFSSRGPVTGASRVLPDVVAPGVNVRSAYPPNTYANLQGTSMATPHVAGAAALLMSINPALKGHPEQVANLLRDTAVQAGVTDPYRSGCGGLNMNDWPNYQAGHGRIDVYAAALAAGLGELIFEDGFDGTAGH